MHMYLEHDGAWPHEEGPRHCDHREHREGDIQQLCIFQSPEFIINGVSTIISNLNVDFKLRGKRQMIYALDIGHLITMLTSGQLKYH